MLFLLQNVLYCLMFILPVKCAVRNNGLNCLYFYISCTGTDHRLLEWCY